MKCLLIILLSIFSINSFAGGGDEPRRPNIDSYEPNLNLQFFGINDTIEYLDIKNKQRKDYVTSNIAVYDISKNTTKYVFSDNINLSIIGFHYESQYIEQYKTIDFNNTYDPSEKYNSNIFLHSNNRNIVSRPISNNIVIVTKDVVSKNYSIWICDKYGNNVKKELEFNDDWNWEIDVKNQMVRISRQFGLKIEIKNINY